MTKPMRDAWADTLVDLAARIPEILVLDGDLATSTRADRFAGAYPERFLQMGIAGEAINIRILLGLNQPHLPAVLIDRELAHHRSQPAAQRTHAGIVS